MVEETREYTEIITKPDAAFFLAYAEGTAIGFAQSQLRRDYVEGTQFSPVGYLEGIYVADNYRKKGVAKALLSAWENERNLALWKQYGCEYILTDDEYKISISYRPRGLRHSWVCCLQVFDLLQTAPQGCGSMVDQILVSGREQRNF